MLTKQQKPLNRTPQMDTVFISHSTRQNANMIIHVLILYSKYEKLNVIMKQKSSNGTTKMSNMFLYHTAQDKIQTQLFIIYFVLKIGKREHDYETTKTPQQSNQNGQYVFVSHSTRQNKENIY